MRIRKCLQEGAGHAVLSAYVEIVFDNSDNRFPVRHANPEAYMQPMLISQSGAHSHSGGSR